MFISVASSMPKLIRFWKKASLTERLVFARLAFAGALAGLAVLGAAFWVLGFQQHVAWDIVAGASGAIIATCTKVMAAA